MDDAEPEQLLHDLVNSLGALLIDLQLAAEQPHADGATARRFDAWVALAETAADQAIQLRDRLEGR